MNVNGVTLMLAQQALYLLSVFGSQPLLESNEGREGEKEGGLKEGRGRWISASFFR